MRLLDIIYYTGLPIALSSTSAVAVFSLILDFTIGMKLLFVIFVITLGSYNLDRIRGAKGDRIDHPERSELFIKNRNIFLPLIIVSLIFGIFIAFLHSIIFGVLSIIAPCIVFIYSSDFGKKQISIKKIPYAKDIIIAGGWTALILVVLVYNMHFFTLPIIFFSVSIFGKFYVMAAAYDFKDVSSDRKNGIKTLPNTFGEKKTRTILHGVNISTTLFILILTYLGLISIFGYLYILAFFYQVALIEKVSENSPKWVYYCMCDLEQFFWLVFAIIIMLFVQIW
jgi:4-hydroxybenzoate polyprenyltransferase